MKYLPLSSGAAVVLLSALVLSACGGTGQPSPVREPDHVIPFRKDGTLTLSRQGEVYDNMIIEVADDDSSRTRGLMQRDGLPQNGGMLFIFDRAEERSFWMANTPLALDIIFIGGDSTIVRVAKYTRPLSQESVASNGSARFVFEVVAGYSDSVGILEGDRVSWKLNPSEE